jgi:hypothetical protein
MDFINYSVASGGQLNPKKYAQHKLINPPELRSDHFPGILKNHP